MSELDPVSVAVQQIREAQPGTPLDGVQAELSVDQMNLLEIRARTDFFKPPGLLMRRLVAIDVFSGRGRKLECGQSGNENRSKPRLLRARE